MPSEMRFFRAVSPFADRSRVGHSLHGGSGLLLLAGCAVGPDFKKPAAPAGQRLYRRTAFDHPPRPAWPAARRSDFSKAAIFRAIGGRLFHSQALTT